MTETGLLVMSYGTARGLDDVEAYYTHVRRGRPPSPEALQELRGRYEAIGGRSPLIEITEDQVRGLEKELNSSGFQVGAYHGMKHQHPYIEDAVRQMSDHGVGAAIGLVLAPHYSRFSVGEYVERATKRAEELGVKTTFVKSYHDDPAFVRFIASRVGDALAKVTEEDATQTPVVFSAHSLPVRILESGDDYPGELQRTADAVARELGHSEYLTAWQSAGRTGEEWLGPDLTDVLSDLASAGHRAAVSCPVGFVSDHLEVLYDIDIEAQDAARAAGLQLVRTESPNADPEFLRALAGVVRDHLSREGW
ncbi:MAG: ferrochelatase [Actinomycetota bacterium]